ncbi:VPS9 domain-containing protein [Snodgrassella gandavensis]|nr:VPS9 domain-containing protein [Snodgrassella gandavensis]
MAKWRVLSPFLSADDVLNVFSYVIVNARLVSWNEQITVGHGLS